MKICGISDIHGNLIENIPECDVLCICGDIMPLSIQRNIEQSRHWFYNRFTSWVKRQPCKKVILVPGNHDFIIEDAYNRKYLNELKQDIYVRTDDKLTILIDELYTYEDIKFYGTPWIKPIEFQEDRWAFSRFDTYEDIPQCDILLTHDNPFCNEALDVFSFGKSKYHLYGHWHDGSSDINSGRYNCSRLNDCYNFKKNYEFVVLDIMTEKEKKQVEQAFLDKLISQAYNNNVADWLKTFKEVGLQQDKEDELVWDTSAEVPESAVISDMED